MRKSSPPEPVLLFVATLYCAEEYFSKAKERLRNVFGDIVLESKSLSWDYSDYYTEELGSPLARRFIFFRDTIHSETLSDIKITTNDIEKQLSSGGRRNINLDPGYLTPHNVVLASTKNYSHRIYIGKGIFAEVTLVYKNGRYRPHLFTYRDFASDEYAEILAQARKLLK